MTFREKIKALEASIEADYESDTGWRSSHMLAQDAVMLAEEILAALENQSRDGGD